MSGERGNRRERRRAPPIATPRAVGGRGQGGGCFPSVLSKISNRNPKSKSESKSKRIFDWCCISLRVSGCGVILKLERICRKSKIGGGYSENGCEKVGWYDMGCDKKVLTSGEWVG